MPSKNSVTCMHGLYGSICKPSHIIHACYCIDHACMS